MAANILFTLPGDVYIYYGEELGMTGEKPDEQIREPFLWDANDKTLTRFINPIQSSLATIPSLSLQLNDTQSVYHHYHKLIEFRTTLLKDISYVMKDAEYGPEILAYSLFDDFFEYILLHNLSPRMVMPTMTISNNAIIYLLNKNVMHMNKKIVLAGFESILIKEPKAKG